MHLFQTEQHVHVVTSTDVAACSRVTNLARMRTTSLSHTDMGHETLNMKETCPKLCHTLRANNIPALKAKHPLQPNPDSSNM